MDDSRPKNRHFDTQAFLYRSFIQIAVIVGAGILIKVVFIDAVRMNGGQMIPAVLSGDVLLVFRTPYLSPFNKFVKPGINKPVLFRVPSGKKDIGCLRVAARSSDTVCIDNGMFVNSADPALVFPFRVKSDQVLPEEYSPRDYFRPYRVPSPGDTLQLDSASIRDLFFHVSVMRQENSRHSIEIRPLLHLDDSVSDNYTVSGFSLYSGTIGSIPAELRDDWFFWVRLEHYLKHVNPESALFFSFAVTVDSVRTHRYAVKENHVFLLADNWNSGFDSRYFGPVRSSNILGRVFSVLWSHEQEPGKKGHIRLNRLGKIVS